MGTDVTNSEPGTSRRCTTSAARIVTRSISPARHGTAGLLLDRLLEGIAEDAGRARSDMGADPLERMGIAHTPLEDCLDSAGENFFSMVKTELYYDWEETTQYLREEFGEVYRLVQ